MTHDRSVTYLKRASAISIGFGLLMFLSILLGLEPAFAWFLDLAHLPLDGTQGFASDSELLLGAICGGLLAGFGVVMWRITIDVYAKHPALGARIIKAGIVTWFLIDSTGSVLAGAWFNVVLNSGFLALFMLPLFLSNMATSARPA
ncbi:excinuclease ABC subunit A [Shimia abyssi]|uniref:Uncharacterized protein n=1 Tax=Shimia abyssi TaxID=1662395 RepID=A0A2P8FFY7_9RHOB|nr:excinuclease ABC subunit A [Shimia abyssi]PSL20621.1 hypothetical protein CLV88_103269 [Shimia abyssi]